MRRISSEEQIRQAEIRERGAAFNAWYTRSMREPGGIPTVTAYNAGWDAHAAHAAAEVEQLKAERDALLNIARRSNHRNCPLFGHSDGTRRRRIDCADDQCMNSEHVKYVECDHVWHDLNEWLAEHGAEGTR